MNRVEFLASIIAVCCVAVALQWLLNKQRQFKPIKCWMNYEIHQTTCAPVCGNGTFSLPGMEECHRWLTCEDQVLVKELIVQSVVKTVYLAVWNKHLIVKSELASMAYKEDFKENLNLLIMLGPNPFTVQLLGHCRNVVYTQYHRLGNAANLDFHLRNSLQSYNNATIRFDFCVNYVRILDYFHTGPIGTRVMCDSNTLEKTLSQYLLTEDLSLVVNDLDALPRVDDRGVLCGRRPLHGLFVAPEQIWRHETEFSPDFMELYDEKIDIWKIPDVCLWFLGTSSEADIIKFKIFNIHKKCKSAEPSQRPTAKQVLEVYVKVKDSLFVN